MRAKNSIQLLMAGDGLVGKTHLVNAYLNKGKASSYDPFEFEQENLKNPYANTNDIKIITKKGPMTILDMHGQEEWDNLRAEQYLRTDTVILVFSVAKEQTFHNIKDNWINQLKETKSTHIPVLIVGVDTEQRSNKKCITQEEVDQLLKKLENQLTEFKYCECSFENQKQIDAVFETASEMAAKYYNAKLSEQKKREQEEDRKIKEKLLVNFSRKNIDTEDMKLNDPQNKLFTL